MFGHLLEISPYSMIHSPPHKDRAGSRGGDSVRLKQLDVGLNEEGLPNASFEHRQQPATARAAVSVAMTLS